MSVPVRIPAQRDPFAKSGIRFGCQLYTWQMSGERFRGRLDHIVRIVRQAGFAGIEPELGMLGAYTDPARLQDLLAGEGLELGALTLVADWRESRESAQERADADAALGMLAQFPGALLVLCQMPGADRRELRQRQDNALACLDAVAQRAAERGIVSAFHPNSPEGSVFRNLEDYRLLLPELARRGLGFAPDSGHLHTGGLDPGVIIAEARDLVRHVHFKDLDRSGAWVGMGAGMSDFPGLVNQLDRQGYRGWIMVEEESPAAADDPDQATLLNGTYLRHTLRKECAP